MAAVVLMPTSDEWPVIEKFLSQIGEGAIVVPPSVQQELDTLLKNNNIDQDLDDVDDTVVQYDFGGEADKWLDVANELNSCGMAAILKELEVPSDVALQVCPTFYYDEDEDEEDEE